MVQCTQNDTDKTFLSFYFQFRNIKLSQNERVFHKELIRVRQPSNVTEKMHFILTKTVVIRRHVNHILIFDATTLNFNAENSGHKPLQDQDIYDTVETI